MGNLEWENDFCKPRVVLSTLIWLYGLSEKPMLPATRIPSCNNAGVGLSNEHVLQYLQKCFTFSNSLTEKNAFLMHIWISGLVWNLNEMHKQPWYCQIDLYDDMWSRGQGELCAQKQGEYAGIPAYIFFSIL